MLDAFLNLKLFFVERPYIVLEVGEKYTRVLGLLKDAPIHMGDTRVIHIGVVHITFHVLEAIEYHFILGR